MGIILKVIGGPIAGKEFRFEEPDMVVFGRASDCRCCLPDDLTVSRHHFLLEVNPPDCRLKDLGSLNGTYINGVKYGGRPKGTPPDPEQAAKTAVAVELKEGDIIGVGETTLRVMVAMEKVEDLVATCIKCGRQIPPPQREGLLYIGGTYLCQECRRQIAPPPPPPAREEKGGGELLEDLLAGIFGKAAQGMPQIPGYDFIRELGRGGFGKVYLVKRQRDGKELALKVMLVRKKAISQKDIKLFQREMANCMALQHPHLVAFYEQGYENGLFYFTMEFCAGGSLRDLMVRRGGYVEVEEALPFMLQALEALGYVHERGFVHRDLKPENILLDKSLKLAKLSDLGLAKNFQQAGLSGFTDPGVFFGTLPFMPREQVTDYKYVRPVSDVFAIGATFYNMLTGQFVYDFAPGIEPLRVILEGKVVPMGKRKTVPKAIASVIDKAISPDSKDRYQTAAEMKRALEQAVR